MIKKPEQWNYWGDHALLHDAAVLGLHGLIHMQSVLRLNHAEESLAEHYIDRITEILQAANPPQKQPRSEAIGLKQPQPDEPK